MHRAVERKIGKVAIVTTGTVEPITRSPLPPRSSKSLGDSPRWRAAFRCPPEATVRQLSSTCWLRGLSPQSRSDAEDTVHRAVERKIGKVAIVTAGTVEPIARSPLRPRSSKSLGDSPRWRAAFRRPPEATSSPTRRLPLAAGTVPAKPADRRGFAAPRGGAAEGGCNDCDSRESPG